MNKRGTQLSEALGHAVVDKRLDILKRIGDAGSISEAARGAGVSYKAAWQAIDTLSNLAGTPLLARTVGGAGGGGAKLTPAGQQLLQAAERLSEARHQVLAQLSPTPGSAANIVPRIRALGLRTSMRNQMPCTVATIGKQGQAMQVELRLPDGSPLHSRVTRESAELLALRPGLEVFALCKATAVTVTAAGAKPEQPNTLSGCVNRGTRARNGGEVAITLDSGLQLVGFTGPGYAPKVGSRAWAHIEASSVVIALAD